MDHDLQTLHQAIAPHFRPGFLQRDETIFQFRPESGGAFHLIVADADFRLQAGDSANPTLTVYVDSFETCSRLLRGQEDGMRAFMEGRYRADGHIVLSQLLLYLFMPSEPTPNIYEVQD